MSDTVAGLNFEDPDESIALEANARNNAMHQPLRLERWSSVRDELWRLVEPRLPADARVALVGAGSCDDVPLARIAARAASVDLIDFDLASTNRGASRLPDQLRSRIRVLQDDVTGGAADRILRAVRGEQPLPESLLLPHDALGTGGYDLVVGDMLYTQLLHAGLIALGVFGDRQRDVMRRYDAPLTSALVQRLHASLAPGGHAIHVHDVACWARDHDQPIELDQALEDPDLHLGSLRRHDACDPHRALNRLGFEALDTAWWRWPFEPSKEFLVRASVARASVASRAGAGAIFRRRRRTS